MSSVHNGIYSRPFVRFKFRTQTRKINQSCFSRCSLIGLATWHTLMTSYRSHKFQACHHILFLFNGWSERTSCAWERQENINLTLTISSISEKTVIFFLVTSSSLKTKAFCIGVSMQATLKSQQLLNFFDFLILSYQQPRIFILFCLGYQVLLCWKVFLHFTAIPLTFFRFCCLCTVML